MDINNDGTLLKRGPHNNDKMAQIISSYMKLGMYIVYDVAASQGGTSFNCSLKKYYCKSFAHGTYITNKYSN